MPYVMRKLPRLPFYRVMNKNTGKVYAKKSTKDKAEAQIRLLRATEKK
jgi:hypothetical protein